MLKSPSTAHTPSGLPPANAARLCEAAAVGKKEPLSVSALPTLHPVHSAPSPYLRPPSSGRGGAGDWGGGWPGVASAARWGRMPQPPAGGGMPQWGCRPRRGGGCLSGGCRPRRGADASAARAGGRMPQPARAGGGCLGRAAPLSAARRGAARHHACGGGGAAPPATTKGGAAYSSPDGGSPPDVMGQEHGGVSLGRALSLVAPPRNCQLASFSTAAALSARGGSAAPPTARGAPQAPSDAARPEAPAASTPGESAGPSPSSPPPPPQPGSTAATLPGAARSGPRLRPQSPAVAPPLPPPQCTNGAAGRRARRRGQVEPRPPAGAGGHTPRATSTGW